jgi:hypothetical protein
MGFSLMECQGLYFIGADDVAGNGINAAAGGPP